MKTKKIVHVGLIAAFYVAITIIFAPISYGMVQVRVSEALTVLPYILPESILGLYIGCLIANIYGSLGLIDIVFGSLATLIAAYLTNKMPSKVLAPLPPVLVNTLIVGFILSYVNKTSLLINMFYVFGGQVISCYLLGLPLLLLLEKYFRKDR